MRVEWLWPGEERQWRAGFTAAAQDSHAVRGGLAGRGAIKPLLAGG